MLAVVLVSVTLAASPAQAAPVVPDTIMVSEDGSITVIPGSSSMTSSGESTQATAATVRVCAPKKCVDAPTSSYCPVSQGGCGQYRFTLNTGYCSPSVGCVTINGQNYTVVGEPTSASQRSAIGACLASLGLTAASASSGGPIGWAIAGVAVAIWGCSTIA